MFWGLGVSPVPRLPSNPAVNSHSWQLREETRRFAYFRFRARDWTNPTPPKKKSKGKRERKKKTAALRTPQHVPGIKVVYQSQCKESTGRISEPIGGWDCPLPFYAGSDGSLGFVKIRPFLGPETSLRVGPLPKGFGALVADSAKLQR